MSAVLLVRHRVRESMRARYEDWLHRIIPAAAAAPGHQGVQVMRPSPHDDEYVIVVRFASEADARTWAESETRRELVGQLEQDRIVDETRIERGIEFWFTPPGAPRPAGWKQWLVTTGVIAPLTMVVPAAFSPIFERLPWLGIFGVSHVIIAGTIVAIVTFAVMPALVSALRPWLYAQKPRPGSGQR